MNKTNYSTLYEKIVKSYPHEDYKGPEQQGNIIEKCTILRQVEEIEYSNHSRTNRFN